MSFNYKKRLTSFKIFLLLSVVCMAFGAATGTAEAAEQILLKPAKLEIELAPGGETIRNLLIANQTSQTVHFNIQLEDVVGSLSGEQAAALLTQEKGPYSLKDYLEPALTDFSLKPQESLLLPVKISLPEAIPPGIGLYGAVVVATIAPEQDGAEETPTLFLPRLGSLFFLKTEGQSLPGGALEEFKISKKSSQEVVFSILFRNQGNVHLNSYGIIEIKDIFGRRVDTLELDPYFSLPNSLRHREIVWQPVSSLGYFRASLQLNRGYDDIIDTAAVSFWLVSWRLWGVVTVVLLAIVFFILFIIQKKRCPKK